MRGMRQECGRARYPTTPQHSTAQHSTAQHSTAQHSTAQHHNTVTALQPLCKCAQGLASAATPARASPGLSCWCCAVLCCVVFCCGGAAPCLSLHCPKWQRARPKLNGLLGAGRGVGATGAKSLPTSNYICSLNSIAFGTAPRREADSQPGKQSVRQSVGQAGRQTGRQKHTVWLFFSCGLRVQTLGNPWCARTVSGRVVKRSANKSPSVNSNPGWRHQPANCRLSRSGR